MGDDFGLRFISENSDVVLLDSCAIQSSRNVSREISGLKVYENIFYMSELCDLLDANVFVTPMVSQELKVFARIAENLKIPRRLKSVISYVCDTASSREICLKPEEKEFFDRAYDHFSNYGNWISNADYEMAVTALATGASRGSTAVMTNDSILTKVFGYMSDDMKNGGAEKLGPIRHPIAFYSKFDEDRFKLMHIHSPCDNGENIPDSPGIVL